jgi:hypothetical protein
MRRAAFVDVTAFWRRGEACYTSTMTDSTSFKRVTIAPFGAMSEAWRRLGDQYWLFVGLGLATIVIGSAAPLALLMGPMMCGLDLCFREKWQGRRVQFEGLFKGFDSFTFLQSFIATLIIVGISLVTLMPLIIVGVLVFVFAGAAAAASQHDSGAVTALFPILAIAGFLIIMLIVMVVNTFFLFTYPLIADRRLEGVAALKLSVRAVRANLGGLLGLTLATVLASLIGLCFCYVGAILLLPVTFGARMVVYEQIFGFAEPAGELPPA